MELTAFSELGLVVCLATFFAIVATKLRQPAILGYIVAGLIIKVSSTFHPDEEQLELFSKFGITLLLFILGLELNINELKSLGKVSIITGLAQIIFSFVTGFLISLALGFTSQAAIFISIGLTFSSTIVVVKLLSTRRQLDNLYGRLSIGLLLIQDFAAILLIVVLSGLGKISDGGGVSHILSQLGVTLSKGVLSGIIIFFFVKFFLNKFLDWIRSEKEVLFFTVISWALVVASIMGSKYVGFSTEMGGLISGIALSSRFEHLQIENWVKPLRDFFLMLFFVLLGLQIDIKAIGEVIVPALVISAFVIISKPLIVILTLKTLGYSRKVSFLTGIAIAQISEFSLIVAKFGFDLGQVNSQTLTLLTIVGGITMTISSYMIFYSEALLKIFNPILDLLKFKRSSADKYQSKAKPSEIVLFGCHRIGQNFLNLIPERKDEILIIDYDPKVIKQYSAKGYHSVYGDIDDLDLYEAFNIQDSQIVISTVPMLAHNKKLLNYLREFKKRQLTIIMANDDDSARELYVHGADYVVYPHMLGSEIIANIVEKGSLSKLVVKRRGRDIERLNLK